jgi:hypothetical protein
MDPLKREKIEHFIEATFEILGEGDEEFCPFSGAR